MQQQNNPDDKKDVKFSKDDLLGKQEQSEPAELESENTDIEEEDEEEELTEDEID